MVIRLSCPQARISVDSGHNPTSIIVLPSEGQWLAWLCFSVLKLVVMWIACHDNLSVICAAGGAEGQGTLYAAISKLCYVCRGGRIVHTQQHEIIALKPPPRIQSLISPTSYAWDVSYLLPLQRCEVTWIKSQSSSFSYIKLANWNSGVSLNVVFVCKFLLITLQKNQYRAVLDTKTFLFQYGEVAQEYLVKCCYLWCSMHCKSILWK